MTMTSNTLHILDATGDTILNWKKGSRKEVAAARKEFKAKIKEGFRAYVLGSELTEFDPDAESIILVPPVQGGYPRSV